MSVVEALSELVESVVAFVVMILLGIASFFVTVFIVDYGAGLANLSPGADFVVLSAALIVASSTVAGAMR